MDLANPLLLPVTAEEYAHRPTDDAAPGTRPGAAHIGTYGRPRTSGWIAHIAGHGRADLADVAHRLEVDGSTVRGTALETAATYMVTTDEIKEKA